MAKAQGLSHAVVHRIWRAHGLQPHRVETFKPSRDPDFVKKLRDVVVVSKSLTRPDLVSEWSCSGTGRFWPLAGIPVAAAC